jgi:hypothetical protein
MRQARNRASAIGQRPCLLSADLALEKGVICFSETSAEFHQTTQYYILQGTILNCWRRGEQLHFNLGMYMVLFMIHHGDPWKYNSVVE